MRPGINVSTSTAAPPTTAPTSTGTWFAAGVTTQGPTSATLITSYQQYLNVFGGRGANPLFADCVETFFNEGGSQMYVARVVGPAASAAKITITDNASAPALSVAAIGPGVYANGYTVVVTSNTDGTYTIAVEDASGNVLETSPELTTNADAVGFSQTLSQTVVITSTGTGVPKTGSYVLAGGVDDLVDVTDAQYTAALGVFTSDLGPGQVSVPGQTSTAVLTALFNHAVANNRIAVGDTPDSASASTLEATATSVRALGQTARPGCLHGPWWDIPALPGSLSLRPVPMSAFFAAKAAQVDANGNPNVPVAGDNAVLTTPVRPHATFSDTDRQALNYAGVNISCKRGTKFKVYGNVTPVNRNTDPEYYQLSNVRLDMAIVAQGDQIAERYEFSQIDGQGLDTQRLANDLGAMLQAFYEMDALYGETPSEAYSVDTGSDVNTPTSEAQGDILAVISCRRSPGAETVNLNIVRVPITQSI